MKRLLIFLLFFTMIGVTPNWADTTNSGATTNSQTNTSGKIRVEVIPLYQVGIRKNQQPHIKVVHHQIQQLQILQTHIQAIVG